MESFATTSEHQTLTNGLVSNNINTNKRDLNFFTIHAPFFFVLEYIKILKKFLIRNILIETLIYQGLLRPN